MRKFGAQKGSVEKKSKIMKSVYNYVVIAIFSAWPIMIFASENIYENLSASVFFIISLINFSIGILLFFGLKLVFRNTHPERIAAAVAIGISGLFTFRVVRELLYGVDLYSHINLVVTWSVIFAVLVVGAWRVVSSEKAIRSMAGVGALMFAIASAPVIFDVLTSSDPEGAPIDGAVEPSPDSPNSRPNSRPNIYYFLIDA